MTRVQVDPNIRVRGGQTFVGFEDCDGLPCVGDVVIAAWDGTSLETTAVVAEVDQEKQLVFLSVSWTEFREG